MSDKNIQDAWKEYMRYGGMPELTNRRNETEKAEYPVRLVKTVYLMDVSERNDIRISDGLESLMSALCSSTGPSQMFLKSPEQWRPKAIGESIQKQYPDI